MTLGFERMSFAILLPDFWTLTALALIRVEFSEVGRINGDLAKSFHFHYRRQKLNLTMVL